MSRNKELPETGDALHKEWGNTTTFTPEQCKYLLKHRPGDVLAVLKGAQPVSILLEDIEEDSERRYPPGYAGLYPYEE